MSSKRYFQMMRLYLMFVTAVCVLFLLKLRWQRRRIIKIKSCLCIISVKTEMAKEEE